MNAGNEKAPKRANASRPESKFQGKEISMNERSTAPMQGASAQIIPFKFESHQVRTLLIDGQPWFVASDIASALAYREAETMTRFLDEEEKGPHNVWTLGGIQRMTCINESGLYSAILRSRKAEAKRFKKWVTAEVLPAIRKNGRYEDGAGQMVTLLGQVIGTDGFHVLASIVNGKVSHLPRPLQRGAKNHIWTQVHRAFSVNTVENIPASQFDAARNFVAAYVYEGEVIDKPSARMSELRTTKVRSVGVVDADGAPRTIVTLNKLLNEIEEWHYENIPDPRVRESLRRGMKEVRDLVVTAWTEVDESLMRLDSAMGMLSRWQGQNGRIGNVDITPQQLDALLGRAA